MSIEVEQEGSLREPYAGYLVFPRWAQTGLGIVGHVESPILVRGSSADEVRQALETLTLHEVRSRLDQAIDAHEQLET